MLMLHLPTVAPTGGLCFPLTSYPSPALPLAHATQAGADAARVPCHAGLSDELRAVPHQHHAGYVCWLHSSRDGEWLGGNGEDSEGAGDGWPPWLQTRGGGVAHNKVRRTAWPCGFACTAIFVWLGCLQGDCHSEWCGGKEARGNTRLGGRVHAL